eukprot:scaffold7003_cov344-Pinguiococcus_pyrenoidosus.AAC.1
MNKCYCTGVTRPYGRGLPERVIQKEVTRRAELEAVKGKKLLQAKMRERRMFACSFYDSKPVHFLSTFYREAHILQHVRRLWKDGGHHDVQVPRLNIAHDYNRSMCGVDRADQLRWYYRPDGRWQRMRK